MNGGDEDVSARSAVAAEFKASSRMLWLVAAGTVRDASLAEDVVQEAAVVALSKSDQFRPVTNQAAWIIQIVRNVAHEREAFVQRFSREPSLRAGVERQGMIDDALKRLFMPPPNVQGALEGLATLIDSAQIATSAAPSAPRQRWSRVQPARGKRRNNAIGAKV